MNRLTILIMIAGTVVCSCVKRTEKITIFSDGSAMLETVVEGDSDDVLNGDAIPTTETGWQINDKVEIQDDGDEEYTRNARLEVGSIVEMPASYSPAGSRLELVSLRFPTTLHIDEREDGTYYHFKRVYQRRSYAAAHYVEESIMEEDDIKEITQKELEDLTDKDREELAKALIKVEAQKTGVFIEQAADSLSKALSQDAWLKARRAAMRVYEDENLLTMVIELINKQEDNGEEEDIENELRNRVKHTVEAVLKDLGVKTDLVDQFRDRYQLVRESYDITEDLGDEEWHVIVELPGRIIAHNSSEPLLQPNMGYGPERDVKIEITFSTKENKADEKRSFTITPGRVGWEFEGQALRDRDVTLMATSFIAKDEDKTYWERDAVLKRRAEAEKALEKNETREIDVESQKKLDEARRLFEEAVQKEGRQ